MKGIILAGGTGSRLFPLTRVASKHLLPVYDKPMVYYPLATLMDNGIREFCLITAPQDLRLYQALLGSGRAWGISIEYRTQPKPRGIADALLVAKSFIGQDSVALILGDNLFHGNSELQSALSGFLGGALIFACHVEHPQSYGVVELDAHGQPRSLQEKPRNPRSNYAVPGLYVFDGQASALAGTLRPSRRGELEISDLNRLYLRRKQLHVHVLSRNFVWFDAGTISSLHEASSYVQLLEKRQAVRMGCPEEAALRNGCISRSRLEALVRKMPPGEYRNYLENVIAERKKSG